MVPTRNPFAPGAGTPPPELAGREELREELRIALGRAHIGRNIGRGWRAYNEMPRLCEAWSASFWKQWVRKA